MTSFFQAITNLGHMNSWQRGGWVGDFYNDDNNGDNNGNNNEEVFDEDV